MAGVVSLAVTIAVLCESGNGRASKGINILQLLLDRSEDALVQLLDAVNAARESGVPDEKLTDARKLQRMARCRVDFINAENSMGFHAPQEAACVLGESMDFAR